MGGEMYVHMTYLLLFSLLVAGWELWRRLIEVNDRSGQFPLRPGATGR